KKYRDRFVAMQKQKQLTSQADTQANFALASAKRGDYSQAISQLREAIAQCGACRSRPNMYKDLGLIECKSGDLSNGRKDLITAQSLDPKDPDIVRALKIVRGAASQDAGSR
ncbi:MAG: hypothetical protein ACRD45_16260, partial [Bryobacteraceae bacterium]